MNVALNLEKRFVHLVQFHVQVRMDKRYVIHVPFVNQCFNIVVHVVVFYQIEHIVKLRIF